MSSTRLPEAALVWARAADSVLFPSPGTDEVVMITCGGASIFESCNVVRRFRMASAAGDAGF
jgi:hypothetical protein